MDHHRRSLAKVGTALTQVVDFHGEQVHLLREQAKILHNVEDILDEDEFDDGEHVELVDDRSPYQSAATLGPLSAASKQFVSPLVGGPKGSARLEDDQNDDQNATPNTPLSRLIWKKKLAESSASAKKTPFSLAGSTFNVMTPESESSERFISETPVQSHLELRQEPSPAAAETPGEQPLIQFMSEEPQQQDQLDLSLPEGCRLPTLQSEEEERYYQDECVRMWANDVDYYTGAYVRNECRHADHSGSVTCNLSIEEFETHFPVEEQRSQIASPQVPVRDSDDEDDGDESNMTVLDLKIMICNKGKGSSKSALEYEVGHKIKKYEIVSLAGDGTFGRTFACRAAGADKKSPPTVCIKLLKNQKMEGVLDGALAEISVLTELRDSSHKRNHRIVRLLECFYYRSTLVLVEDLHHDNLYEVMKHFEGTSVRYFNEGTLKLVARQVLEALDYMHSKGVIHADLKPENILLTSPMHANRKPDVVLVDFGSAVHLNERAVEWYVQTRPYRSPEVILGAKFSTKMDMWSLGAILAELFRGDLLFTNKSVSTMLAQMIGMCGPLPEWMLEEGLHVRNHFRRGLLYEWVELQRDVQEDANSGPQSPPEFIVKLHFPKPTSLRDRIRTDDEDFLDFLSKLLTVDPGQRFGADEAIQHPWLRGVSEE